MAIKIVDAVPTVNPIKYDDIQDGHAYISNKGVLYIGNKVFRANGYIFAFSVNGKDYITAEDSDLTFREVNITVTIEQNA